MKSTAWVSRLIETTGKMVAHSKPMDWLTIAFVFILVVVISIYSYGGVRTDSSLVTIQTPKGTWLFPIIEDRTFSTGPDGSCLISIKDSSARVIESNCPRKICMLQGSIEKAGQWLACVPHQVFINVTGETAGYVDELSY